MTLRPSLLATLAACAVGAAADAEVRTRSIDPVIEDITSRTERALEDAFAANGGKDVAGFCQRAIATTRGGAKLEIEAACAETRIEGKSVQSRVINGPSIVRAAPGGTVCSVVGEKGRQC